MRMFFGGKYLVGGVLDYLEYFGCLLINCRSCCFASDSKCPEEDQDWSKVLGNKNKNNEALT